MRNKREMYRMWLQNRCSVTYDRYKVMKSEVKRAVKRAKRNADVR